MKEVKSYKELKKIIGDDDYLWLKNNFPELSKDARDEKLSQVFDEDNFTPESQIYISERGGKKMITIRTVNGNYCMIPILK